MTDRSLRTVVTDTFTAARWVHHLVKLATGAVVFLLLAVFFQSYSETLMGRSFHLGATLPIATLFSLAWFFTLRIAYALDHREPLLKPDLACDFALHAFPIAVFVCWFVHRGIGAALAGVLALLYFVSYAEASP